MPTQPSDHVPDRVDDEGVLSSQDEAPRENSPVSCTGVRVV